MVIKKQRPSSGELMTLACFQSRRNSRKKQEEGALTTELMVALGILVVTMLPLAVAFTREHRLIQTSYQKSVAMEIIDGEMEILAAGEWHNFQQGTHPYPLHAQAAKNLPTGKAMLTVDAQRLRLEWVPEEKGFRVTREAVGK
ncbi:type IV pilus modification PilV family protein [Pedosphaera parvula]|uniref:Uncharacterized protein n=1 Tax=Pedosphaera parvula (strain Ellin514) TaxID=320771 RepID=B9XSX6_PEDPL|nr:hypothetical protein [Pedosphaera parvula]EEF57060.1 hypothetical protein Cflav_PD0095 [Pedosphaera parvula Ellin514]